MRHPFLAVVDDEPGIRLLVSEILSMGGYACETFEDGQEFLDNHHPATSGVILGMHMAPLNGFDTLREMRRRGMKMPVITMSAVLSPDEVPGVLLLGSKAHFAKPFQIEDMLEAVAKVIG
jgi:two-component system response regulator (stage 0 sporulation protein F)